MAKQRKHTLLITITMDRPCTAGHAAREVKDCIHGTFYPTAYEDGDPEEFRVASIRMPPAVPLRNKILRELEYLYGRHGYVTTHDLLVALRRR